MEAFRPDYSYYGNYMRSLEAIADRHEFRKSRKRKCRGHCRGSVTLDLNLYDNFNLFALRLRGDDPVASIRNPVQEVRLRKLIEIHGDSARDRFEHELESMESFAADFLASHVRFHSRR